MRIERQLSQKIGIRAGLLTEENLIPYFANVVSHELPVLKLDLRKIMDDNSEQIRLGFHK